MGWVCSAKQMCFRHVQLCEPPECSDLCFRQPGSQADNEFGRRNKSTFPTNSLPEIQDHQGCIIKVRMMVNYFFFTIYPPVAPPRHTPCVLAQGPGSGLQNTS